MDIINRQNDMIQAMTDSVKDKCANDSLEVFAGATASLFLAACMHLDMDKQEILDYITHGIEETVGTNISTDRTVH